MAKSMGRPTIFGPKDGDRTYRILALTKAGQRAFETARKELQRLAKWPGPVSDADTVEHLVRGREGTLAYLRTKK